MKEVAFHTIVLAYDNYLSTESFSMSFIIMVSVLKLWYTQHTAVLHLAQSTDDELIVVLSSITFVRAHSRQRGLSFVTTPRIMPLYHVAIKSPLNTLTCRDLSLLDVSYLALSGTSPVTGAWRHSSIFVVAHNLNNLSLLPSSFGSSLLEARPAAEANCTLGFRMCCNSQMGCSVLIANRCVL